MADILDIQINIGAKTEDLGAELVKAENLLKKLQLALKKSTDVGEINQLTTKIGSVNGAITQLNARMGGVQNPTDKATQSLINFSRIAQDAPYGILGIANNLNPMLESFQQLSKTEGGTKKALDAMLNGLSGPAGIGVALGLVSSLAVVFRKEITEAFEGPAGKLKDLREELKKLNDEIYKMAGSAQASQTLGTELVNRITNQNLDITQRENALRKFKDLYSENKEIKDLEIKDLKSYNAQYLQSLNNRAAVQQLEVSKEKNYIDGLSAANSKYKKLIEERDDKKKQTYATTRQLESGTTTKMLRSAIDAEYLIPLKEAQQDIANAKASLSRTLDITTLFDTEETKKDKKDKKDPFTELTKDFDKSLKAQETLRGKAIIDQKTYLDNVYKIYDDYIKKLAELDTTKATKKIENLLPEFDKMTLDKNATIIKNGIKNMLDAYQEPKMDIPLDTYAISQKKLEEARNKYETFFLGIKEKKVDKKYKDEQKDLEELTKEYEQFAQTLSSTVTGALFGMFDAMEKGATATQALDQMFGRLLKQMAEMVLQAALFAAIMSLLPGGSIASGGKGFLGFFKQAFGFAEGGIVTGPTLGMIGEGNESEAVLPLSKLGNIMQSSFNAGSMSGYGGGQNGQFILRGQDLVLALQRSNSSLTLRR